jgi:hypothetical protein
MDYRGHVKNGQIVLDEPAELPEGATVSVTVLPQVPHIQRAKNRLGNIKPIELPGPSLAEELIRDRR